MKRYRLRRFSSRQSQLRKKAAAAGKRQINKRKLPGELPGSFLY